MKRWMVGLAVLVCCVGRVEAEMIFFDSFDGPQLNPGWTGTSYAAPLNYSFETIDGNNVLRCTDVLDPYSYKTLVNAEVFSPADISI